MFGTVIIPGPPPVVVYEGECEVTTSVEESSRRGIALAEPDWNPDDEAFLMRTLPPPICGPGNHAYRLKAFGLS